MSNKGLKHNLWLNYHSNIKIILNARISVALKHVCDCSSVWTLWTILDYQILKQLHILWPHMIISKESTYRLDINSSWRNSCIVLWRVISTVYRIFSLSDLYKAQCAIVGTQMTGLRSLRFAANQVFSGLEVQRSSLIMASAWLASEGVICSIFQQPCGSLLTHILLEFALNKNNCIYVSMTRRLSMLY